MYDEAESACQETTFHGKIPEIDALHPSCRIDQHWFSVVSFVSLIQHANRRRITPQPHKKFVSENCEIVQFKKEFKRGSNIAGV